MAHGIAPPCVGLPTAHRETRQAREGATVAESGCGRPLPILWPFLCVALLSTLVAAPAHAADVLLLLRVIVVPELTLGVEEGPPEAMSRPPPSPFPFLRGEDASRSVSVGDTSNGYLVNGRRIAESQALGILPEQKARGLDFGSEALAGMLEHAASTLFAATGTKLWIGNVAAESGGDIEYSVSHNSGLDADIAFCYQSLKGEPADPPDLLPLNGQGLSSTHPLTLDAHRTWLTIKALLSYPAAQVQYLFMADGLRDQVLLAAQAAREDVRLIQLAAAVIRQPIGSAPHNDHLHLRIYCSQRDVLAGCHNTGWLHPWTNTFEDDKGAFEDRVAERLSDPDAAERKSAIGRLALLDARGQADAVARHLEDDHRDVREGAARALGRIGRREQIASLAGRFVREPDDRVRMAVIGSIADLGGRAAGEFLAEAVGRPELDRQVLLSVLDAAATVRGPALLSLLPDTVRALGALEDDRSVSLAAIAACARAERLEPAPALMALLDDRDPLVRQMAAHALRMSTNVSYGIRWDSEDRAHLDIGRQRWRAAWSRTLGAPRDSWLLTGFRAAGYRIPELRQKYTWEIVRAVGGEDHISYNAQRVLSRLFDEHPPSAAWSKRDACQWWLHWLKRRHRGLRIDKPPPAVVAACYR